MTDDAGWVSISVLAEVRGVTRQSASERVTRLEQRGALVTRRGKGREKLVNLAEFDRAIGQTGDAVQLANGTAGEVSDPILAREQARRTSYQAELARLDLEERIGKLIPVEGLDASTATVGEAIIRVLDGLPQRADEIAAAVAEGGTTGVRSFLKAAVHAMRADISRSLRTIAEIETRRLESLPSTDAGNP